MTVMNTTGYINSYGSYKFPAYQITDKKKKTVYGLAVIIQEIKNKISTHFNEHLEDFLWREYTTSKSEVSYGNISTINFQKYVHSTFSDLFSPIEFSKNSFYKSVADDILNNYLLKWSNTVQTIKFYTISSWTPVLYQRNTKNHKKYDLKEVEIKKNFTPLAQTLMYLARYGNPHTVHNLQKKVNNKKTKENDKKFYQQILNHISKFGWERLYGLALRKRNRVIEHYFSEPIVYEKLTMRGRCRKKDIIGINKNSSVIDAFINLSGISQDYKNFYIPVKYSKEFFGDMDDYNKQHNEFMYIMTFDEVTKNPTVILQKEIKREFVILSDDKCVEKIKGIDVNVKHNLIVDSDGKTYDVNRDIVYDYLQEIYKTYKLKKEDKHYNVGSRRQRKIDKMSKKVIHMEQELIANVCKDYQFEGVTHIVLEDLANRFGKCFIKKTISKIEDSIDEEEKHELELEVNNALISKFLKISSIKDEFIRIAAKYGIAVSLVQASYTSQMCPKCGHITRANRKNQEDFICQNCGHTDNADHNAAINIRDRVVETVFHTLLQKISADNTFRPSPKFSTKEKVRRFLSAVRYDGCSPVGVSEEYYSDLPMGNFE